MPNADSYATSTTIAAADELLGLHAGALKNFPISTTRGYVDASHYADVDEQVLDAGTSITNWVVTRISDPGTPGANGGVLQLGGTTPESVRAYTFLHVGSPYAKFYVNLPADVTVGDHAEVAFDFTSSGDIGNNLGIGGYMHAFVASAVDGGGTVNYTPGAYTEDLTQSLIVNDLQWQGLADPTTGWATVRIPLAGLTSVRSIGFRQWEVGNVFSARCWINIRNVRLREGTGFDRAVYGAPAGAHIVIPKGYTTAKTQLPIYREQTNITWEDRR